MLNITHALFVLQPILYSYFRSSCSWRVRTGKWKEGLSGALLDRFKSQQRLKFLRISSAIMTELTGTKIFNGL